MQFRYLIFGLLLAAIFVGAQWINNLPGIQPVRMPASEPPDLPPTAVTDQTDSPEDRFRLWDDANSPATDAGQAIVLPALNASDGWLREQMTDHALPWLAETELVRTAATVLENAARGQLPRKFLGFLAPEGAFAVRQTAGGLQADPASYQRYDSFVSTLQTLPPARAAELFRLVEPLLAEAVRELGKDDATPRQLAYSALGIALATPRVEPAVRLQQPKVMYTYADAALEELAPLQKQLLRMGPDNLQALRLWLEDFGVALSPASLLPEELGSPAEPRSALAGDN